MEPRTFEKFRRLIYEQSGIALGPGKEALVSARIGKRMRVLQMNSLEEYLRRVVSEESGAELGHMIDAISTNVTSFFREGNHFDFLAEALRKWVRAGRRAFRIWSAASSTGEEPYTIAITLNEALGPQADETRILATDISSRVLQQCVTGRYAAEKLRQVPIPIRDRYFTPERRNGELSYCVKPHLRGMISFARLNLNVTPYPMQGPFDVVFCRNVMIYFDREVRLRLLGEIHRLLRPDGYLFVGHAESLTGLLGNFKAVHPAIYRKD